MYMNKSLIKQLFDIHISHKTINPIKMIKIRTFEIKVQTWSLGSP
jgi:hypothetical protein